MTFVKSETDQRGSKLAESHYRGMPESAPDADSHAQEIVNEIKDRLSKGKQLTADQRSMLQAVGFSAHKLESMAKGGKLVLPGFVEETDEELSKGFFNKPHWALDEERYFEALRIASDEGKGDNWRRVKEIYRRLTGIRKSEERLYSEQELIAALDVIDEIAREM